MFLANKISVSLLLAPLFVLVAGCSKSGNDPNASQEEAQLKDVHEIYMVYVKKNQAPPKQFSDINQLTYSEGYAGGFTAIKEGNVVVVWGVSGTDSGTVLAYPKDAPEKGGPVLMADGKIKTMTADELKAAIKK
jgi:hypothetical protein